MEFVFQKQYNQNKGKFYQCKSWWRNINKQIIKDISAHKNQLQQSW